MIDFREITNRTSLYNFHSHTQFCDGRDEMEAFVKEAIRLGFSDIGFSPHSPIPFFSPCNMKEEDVPSYMQEIQRLKMLYADKIKIYASMEIDYLDDWGPANTFFKEIPLDYKIGSIHFIRSFVNSDEFIDIDGAFDNFNKKMSCYFNGDIKSVVDSFYNQTLNMIESGGFDIIGHFDKISFNASEYQEGIENEKWYQTWINRVVEAIMDNGYMIEINTKAFKDYNRFFPNQRYFSMLKKYNAPIVVNSDVHFPNLINSGRFEAMNLLNNY